MTSSPGRPGETAEFMIKSVEINNFRGFPSLSVDSLAPINLIVGDNAVGKTAFLESIFLTLCAGTNKGLSLKQWRGTDVTIQKGNVDSVVDAIYADLFNDPDSTVPISIKLTGTGFENRELKIEKTRGDIFIPTKSIRSKRVQRGRKKSKKSHRKSATRQSIETGETITAPILMTWHDESGIPHSAQVRLSPAGIQFEGTGESVPLSFMFASQAAVPAAEAAQHYSELRKRRDHETFRKLFLSVFNWITDISVEADGVSPVLVADVPWGKQLLPLSLLSGGTSRVAAILLSLSRRRGAIVMIDEIENGIYHSRQAPFATALLAMARHYESQIIATTHSAEWIDNFIDAAKGNTEDIALWRMERIKDGFPSMRRFSAMEYLEGASVAEMR